MTAARERMAIGQLTHLLAGKFDLPTVLDTVADDACDGFEAAATAVVVLDARHHTGDSDLRVVAESLRGPTTDNLDFLTGGPALASAREGAVTMIADLEDAGETRWPQYRRAARQAGMRGVRAFPVTVLGEPLGALVVHTADPWGTKRLSECGQMLADLAAIAISIGAHRGSDTRATVETLLQGAVAIATATGIMAELSDIDAFHARLHLRRLARAHGVTVSDHAQALIEEYNRDPRRVQHSGLLATPGPLPPPPLIGS